MAMLPPGGGGGQDPNPDRSFLARLIMNLFNQGQPFQGAGGGQGAGQGMFPAAPGSGISGMFPQPPGGPPTDMSVAGPWGAGPGGTLPPQMVPGILGSPAAAPATTPATAPAPTSRPSDKRRNRGEY
jgi:hypothetical protein